MNLFYVSNQKFNDDARKAFFNELSTRLEFMAEDLSLHTDDKHFEEMAEILKELRTQANSERCKAIMADYKPELKIEFKNDEVKF